MFSSMPEGHIHVTLPQFNYSYLTALVRFIYNGSTTVDKQMLPSLMDTAKQLGVSGFTLEPLEDQQRKSVIKFTGKSEGKRIFEETGIFEQKVDVMLKTFILGKYNTLEEGEINENQRLIMNQFDEQPEELNNLKSTNLGNSESLGYFKKKRVWRNI